MSRVINCLRNGSTGRWCWVVALVGCLGLSGCMSMDELRGDRFPEDESAKLWRDVRGRDKNTDSFLSSNKARQISRDLGAE
jgi:type IV pilus biogenesis protein CpaD/CtpE